MPMGRKIRIPQSPPGPLRSLIRYSVFSFLSIFSRIPEGDDPVVGTRPLLISAQEKDGRTWELQCATEEAALAKAAELLRNETTQDAILIYVHDKIVRVLKGMEWFACDQLHTSLPGWHLEALNGDLLQIPRPTVIIQESQWGIEQGEDGEVYGTHQLVDVLHIQAVDEVPAEPQHTETPAAA